MSFQPLSNTFPCVKGLVASNQPLAQPKGSFPRGSNLVMMERGALTPCDGSGIINWFNGAVQSTQGRFMATFLYEPTGVQPYYLAIKKIPGLNLNAPINLTAAAAGAGGTLGTATYYYKVTALDGVGGETTVSNEANLGIAANHKITLTWNVVPNAFGYNVYRSTSPGTEVLLTNAILPVIQPAPLTATVTFTDDGSSASGTALSATASSITVGGSPYTTYNWTTPFTLNPGIPLIATGFTPGTFNGTFLILSSTTTSALVAGGPGSGSGTGGTVSFGGNAPPVSNTTQQTALFKMPLGQIPITYSNANIVALFPASIEALGQVPTGGSGGAGTTGPGINGQGTSTPSGGVVGLVGPLPQFRQFTNRVIIALGNGFPPQIYSDSSGTTVNPATTAVITSVTADANGVVTVVTTTPHGLTTANAGANVLLAGITNSLFNGVFVVTSVTNASTYIILNPATISIASAGGTSTTTTIPVFSTFISAFPTWAVSTAYAVGDIIVPKTQPGAANIYLTCLQTGVSGSVEPSWPVVLASGQQFPTGNTADGSVAWIESGYLTTPPPPGAGHIEIYAGSLWVLNTSPTNTANGLDGPTALRMSNLNNPNAWNPVNQAFLDKDDGAEGMGLGKFTITAQGIPPEGSLIAFKYRVPYQIIGVFGANNFAIQPVSSDMGCLAPRSINFIPGYGLVRYCHLGIAVFDGWKDQIISEQIRPYFFPVNDFDAQDIVVADANYLPLSWGTQTANPPMYALAIPIGNSGGQLTRMMLYDLVLKAWAAPVDLPFPIGCMSQVQPVTSNPLTIIGGFNDGAMQRWQTGDEQWYTGGGASAASINWSLRTVTVASQNSSQRLWARKVIIRGTNSGAAGKMTVQSRMSEVVQFTASYPIPAKGDFDVFADIGLTGLRFDAILSGTVDVEINGIDFLIEPRPIGVPVAAI